MREIWLKIAKALVKSYGTKEAEAILVDLVDKLGDWENGGDKMD